MNRKATLASFQFANITEQMLSLYGVEQHSVGSLLATVKVHLDVGGLGTVYTVAKQRQVGTQAVQIAQVAT